MFKKLNLPIRRILLIFVMNTTHKGYNAINDLKNLDYEKGIHFTVTYSFTCTCCM